jgi:hypothetical protein
MRCGCCDRVLSEDEIQFNPEIKAWEMCSTCVDIAMDAAYSGSFSYDDDEDYLFVTLDDGVEDLFVATDLGLTSTVKEDWSSYE